MSSDDEGFELFDVDASIPTIVPRTTFVPQDKKQDDEQLRFKKKKDDEQQQEEEQIPEDFKAMVQRMPTVNPKRPRQTPTICEVPKDLAEGNKGAYTPKVVCIGPLFDSKDKTASMLRLENYKCYCVNRLIVRARRQPATATVNGTSSEWSAALHSPLLEECSDEMKQIVPQVRASYSYSSISSSKHTNDEQVATKMLLDGCFILYRLLKVARIPKKSLGGGEGNSGNEDADWTRSFSRRGVWGTVTHDLLLLSNQVPFLVLRKLFQHLGSNSGDGDDGVLVNNALQLFSALHPHRLHEEPIASDKVHHLLHLFYLSVDLPQSPSPTRQQQQQQGEAMLRVPELMWWAPSAKELEAAGVHIRASNVATSFLDVRFHRGVLHIPPLQLFDYSETLFRNLIAFEHTYPDTPGRITTYAIFMDCLLKTDDDVRLLRRRQVLVNHMDGKKKYTTREFFSSLCAEARTSANRNNLVDVMEAVVSYKSGRWPRWRAALVTNPWLSTSLAASAVLLALTVLQTFYTAIPYYKPTK
ncbi:hypothetical protein QYE76_009306 [Lolium multiflorum]|uniref:Uncharacterized protein n=1 Tax=Lolium multiflorum TaxID=4521 RepID=A0AAD8TUS1_LOLMU|nr:hypothetical protein QYE76_009306 [Lolium multiflorum]